MNIICMDCSKTNTGLYMKVNGVEIIDSIANSRYSKKKTALVHIYESLKALIEKHNFGVGIVEDYGFNFKNKKSFTPLAEIGGVVRLLFAQYNIPLIRINSMTWKSLTIGTQADKKSKEDYLLLVKKKYGRLFKNDDEADAFMMYTAARIIAKKTKRLTPVQEKIKEEIRKAIELDNKAKT